MATILEDGTTIKGGHHRPRRPSPETITYLKSLPLDLEQSTEEVSRFLSSSEDERANPNDNGGIEYPQIMAAALSAIDEIRHEIASLAGDETGAEILEQLTRIASPYSELAARHLLVGCLRYCMHLATHRYGSHVLQSLLQLAAHSSNSFHAARDIALYDDAPPLPSERLPSLMDVIAEIQNELEPHAAELSGHLCGSHVLRTLVCILGGVRIKDPINQGQQLRRGKPKKKKKHPNDDESPFARSGARGHHHDVEMLFEATSRIAASADAKILLNKLTATLSGTRVEPPGVLQQMACHASGGPLLIVLLRTLTYRAAPLKWQRRLATAKQEDEKPFDRQLARIRPEPTFEEDSEAHHLAERLLCWQRGEQDQKWAGDVIYGLAGEPRGSHLLEALLKLSPDSFYSSILEAGNFMSSTTLREYAEHNVSNFVVQTLLATLRKKDDAQMMIEALLPLVSSGYLLDLTYRRRGIFWRAAEQAAKFSVFQKELLEALEEGMSTASSTVKSTGLASCVIFLLNMEKPDDQYGRLTLDAPGARALYHLLRFEPGHCKDIIRGILNLSKEELAMLCKDSLGSRCVWDGLLEGPNDQIFEKALQELLSRLSGHWTSLATDRVGHHSVKKLFRRLPDMEDRKRLVNELSDRRSRLNGCAMGRSVMEACMIREYNSMNEDQWDAQVKKMLKKKEWLEEIILEDETPSKNKENSKKRKKEVGDKESKSKRVKSDALNTTVSLGAIMDAITIPKGKQKEKTFS